MLLSRFISLAADVSTSSRREPSPKTIGVLSPPSTVVDILFPKEFGSMRFVFLSLMFLALATENSIAQANLGLGRVSSVIPLDGGCVFQDSLPLSGVESWDVAEARTYSVMLTSVTDCANGGTDPTLEVLVRSSSTGSVCVTATKIATGTYEFTVTMPPNACNTYPIHYCTSCSPSQGFFARRADGGSKQSHLRAATFGAGCTAPASDIDCTPGCAAYVIDRHGGCGAPAPSLHSTTPVAGFDNLISIKGALPGAPIYFAANAQPLPSPQPMGGGCILHVDPLTAEIIGPFTATSIGDFYLSLNLPPSMPIFSALIQAAVIAPGGPLSGVWLTNAIESKFGTCAPFCTHIPSSLSTAPVLQIEYQYVFPTGIEVGVYDPSSSAAPNGLRWAGDAAGLAALQAFLAGAGGPSGPLSSDGLNLSNANGGGSLALQAAALTLNIGFNAAGVLAGAQNNFGSLVYLKMDVFEPLSGFSVSQILNIANQALAGNGLPSGETFESLATFLEFLNSSFAGCTMGWPASHRLYNADYQ